MSTYLTDTDTEHYKYMPDLDFYLIAGVQSKLYYKVAFGTKIKWPYKTGDLLKEIQFT